MAPDLADALIATAIVSAFVVAAWRLIRYARSGKAGAHALGALLVLFGVGDVREPDRRAIDEARMPERRDDDSGDPPAE